MRSEANWFDRLLYRRGSPVALGVCRFVFFSTVLLLHAWSTPSKWPGVPKNYYQPVGLFDLLHLPMLHPNDYRHLITAWWCLMALAAAGLWTRLSVILSLIVGLYVLGFPSNFGKVEHGQQIIALIMLIFACSRCGDGFSVDRLIARRQSPLKSSREYGWPIVLARLVLAGAFFAAGVTKLRLVGLSWITSDNFALLLRQAHYSIKQPPTTWGLALAQHTILCRCVAGGAVALELAFPLALLHRRLAMTLVPMAALMQIGIGLMMGVWFTPWIAAYLMWLPWRRMTTVTRRLIRARPSPFSAPASASAPAPGCASPV